MGSTEDELHCIIKDLKIQPYFLGVYDKRFPGFINKHKICCAIINTAGRETGGMHWLALGWFPPKQLFYLFDPFGFSDAKLKQVYNFEYQGLLKRSALSSSPDKCVTLIQSKETIQGPNSAACGLFCCMFLHAFINWPLNAMNNNPTMDLLTGVSNHLLMASNVQNILYKNQNNLYKFLNNKSYYFRTHRRAIENNTHFNKSCEL
ncbi:protease [California sea lion adenovirus 1]|uniref:Protease n=1 Tax=California sea lion adenovirus 1 TaxID=943083 RepID=A0A059XN98_9ADEN|nr:protease [California sea lion adenovirus 1]AIA22358.1 protease [California sea lion adenovirus 1]